MGTRGSRQLGWDTRCGDLTGCWLCPQAAWEPSLVVPKCTEQLSQGLHAAPWPAHVNVGREEPLHRCVLLEAK